MAYSMKIYFPSKKRKIVRRVVYSFTFLQIFLFDLIEDSWIITLLHIESAGYPCPVASGKPTVHVWKMNKQLKSLLTVYVIVKMEEHLMSRNVKLRYHNCNKHYVHITSRELSVGIWWVIRKTNFQRCC